MSERDRVALAPHARRVAAATVHLLTASGAVWGLLALKAISEGRIRAALGWMAVAVLVDAFDGLLARRLRVATVLPALDGTLLDNLMDYLNYVVVPAWLLARADLLPAELAWPAAALVAVASAFQFTHVEAKTADHRFRGFPSCWNVAVFYLLLLRPAPVTAALLVGALCVLLFVPIRYPYPTRTPELRRTTLLAAALWAAALARCWYRYPAVEPWLVHASLLFPLYYFGLGLASTLRSRAPRRLPPPHRP